MTDPYANQPVATLPSAVYLCNELGMHVSLIILFWTRSLAINHTTGRLIGYRRLPIIYLYVSLSVSHGANKTLNICIYTANLTREVRPERLMTSAVIILAVLLVLLIRRWHSNR